MTATATGSLYEVQGLAPCPADDHPNDNCSVPDEGEWHGIFFVDSRSEAEETLEHVMDSDSPLYEKFEDYRIAVPTDKALKRRRERGGFVWEVGKRRPVVVNRYEEPAVTVKAGKKKRKKAKVA